MAEEATGKNGDMYRNSRIVDLSLLKRETPVLEAPPCLSPATRKALDKILHRTDHLAVFRRTSMPLFRIDHVELRLFAQCPEDIDDLRREFRPDGAIGPRWHHQHRCVGLF